MELMNVKGTFDYLPKDMIIRNRITDTLKRNFEKYGYMPLETPMLNYFELLSYKYNDDAEILNEVYRLKDQGDRDLGLRYDLTVPFCKVVGLTKGLTLPFRRYEIGKVFRNGPVKVGRTREFYQCDVDIVGIDGRFIEAEQILMAIVTYKELGIEVFVKYNNRKLMSGLIKLAGIPDNLKDSVIGIIDKLEKVTQEELIKMLSDLNIDISKINKLLEYFNNNKISYFESLTDTNELIQEGILELKENIKYFEELNIKDNCIFTPTLARGLSIYTGIVFEIYDKEKRLTCAIGGGGRYDKIITNFINDGTEYPAVGFSFGLEPIYTILKEQNKNASLIDVYIVPLDTEIASLKLATKLRNNGFNVLIEMRKRKIGKCFEYAERENIKNIMIVGEDEITSGNYKIKNFEDKVEYTYKEEELINFLKNKITQG